MNNKLYLECYSGISGDMMVAALLDLGADQEILNKALNSLSIHGFHTKISRVNKSGLDACDFAVLLDSKHENHDHDMQYLHGDVKEEHNHGDKEVIHYNQEHNHEHDHSHEQNHEHSHEHSHENNHEHTHEHSHQHNHEQSHEHYHENNHEHTHEKSHEEPIHQSHDQEHHEHRGLTDIIKIINQADITTNAKDLAVRIFTVLAKAEAKVHGVDIHHVHFHEVGAVDSIVDIVAVAVCMDNLGIQEMIVPVLYDGTGFIRCQHGIIPVPVPAVAAIVADNGLNLHITETQGEFVTPTGAAIVAALRTSNKLPQQFSVEKIGLGAGKRNYERPSLLRAMIIQENLKEVDTYRETNSYREINSFSETNSYMETDIIYKLESNIDDCTGEALGYVMDRLFEAGARDVNYMPVFMKKNRPAYQLNVICKEQDLPMIEQIIFQETTTIGIRKQKMERSILKRKLEKIQTSLGEVQVKVCDLSSGRRVYPEYSSIIEICKKHHMSYQDVYRIILAESNLK